MIKYIKQLVRGNRSEKKYEEMFSEKKLEMIYHFWEHVGEDIEVLEKIGIIEFFESYELSKRLEPEEIFKAGQQSIIGELTEIYNELHLKK